MAKLFALLGRAPSRGRSADGDRRVVHARSALAWGRATPGLGGLRVAGPDRERLTRTPRPLHAPPHHGRIETHADGPVGLDLIAACLVEDAGQPDAGSPVPVVGGDVAEH